MCFFRIGYALAVGIALKLFHDARANPLSCRRFGGSDKWRKRRCGQMVQRESAFDPLDRCADAYRERSCDGDHSGVQINSYDTSSRTDTFRCGASDDASPASNVQHALADTDISDIDKQTRPGSDDVPSDVALVQIATENIGMQRL